MWFTQDVNLCLRCGCLLLQITTAEGRVLGARNPRELEDGRVEFEEIHVSTTYG